MSEREHGAESEAEEKEAEVEQAVEDLQSPGVQDLTNLVGHGRSPDLAAVVELFRRHPAERDALMATVHRLLGNAAASEVAAALAPAAAVEGAAVDEAAGREPSVAVGVNAEGAVEVESIAGSAPAPLVAETATPEAMTDPVAARVDQEMREGGIAAVTAAPEVEKRLGEVAQEAPDAVPEAPTGSIETADAAIQVEPQDQVVLEAAAMVDRDQELTVSTEIEVFREQVDQLPLSSEGRNQVLGAYAEMAAGVQPEAIEVPVEDEIREQV